MKNAAYGEYARHEEEMRIFSPLRGSALQGENKDKSLSPIWISGSLSKSRDMSTCTLLTNKESVYGLFLEELMQYYKCFPLEDLDFGFFKSMRKQCSKASELHN